MGWQEGNLERGASIQRNLAGLQNIAKMQIDTALARRDQELERQKLELAKQQARSDALLDWMSLANQAYQAGEDRKNRVETATAPIRETDRLSKDMYGWTPESGTSFAEWKARKDREAELGLYDEQLKRQLEYLDLLRKRGFDSGTVDGMTFGTHNPYTDGGLSRTFLEDLNWGLKTDTEEVFARIGIESGLDRLFVQTEEAGQYPGGTMWFRSESAIDPKRALEWLRDNDPNNPTWKEIKDPNELTEKQYRNSINAVMRERYIDNFLANFDLDLQQLRMINPGRVDRVVQMLEDTFRRRFPGDKYTPPAAAPSPQATAVAQAPAPAPAPYKPLNQREKGQGLADAATNASEVLSALKTMIPELTRTFGDTSSSRSAAIQNAPWIQIIELIKRVNNLERLTPEEATEFTALGKDALDFVMTATARDRLRTLLEKMR